MAAFRLAREMGADGIELDAQRCASGEIVVMHDDSLGRTTGFAGLVTETAWSVIGTLDAGRGERVPLLSQVLAEIPLRINVELKCDRADDRGLTAQVVKLVREARATDRVLLSSFNPLCLARARLLAPEIPRALLFESGQQWVFRSALAAPLLGVKSLHPEHILATPGRVKRWRKRGYLVACWTVNDLEAAARLVDSGATGIITNHPDRMRARWP